MKRCVILLLAALLCLTACSDESPAPSSAAGGDSLAESSALPSEDASGPEPKTNSGWQFDVPENHAIDPELLSELHEVLAGSAVYAMVTAKDGVIVDEYYQDGYDENSTFALHSCSKSFTSALVGIALERGEIGSIDDPLSDYLPQVLELEDTGKQRITLRHLLTHTSGLEWYEWGGGKSTWGDFRSSENWVNFILSQRLVAEPGSYFAYSTGGTHLLAAALEQAVGMSEFEYGKAHLFGPLGMESVFWGADPQGVTDGGNGIVLTARDAARFGQLYLEGGAWNGQQIVPAQWVEESTAVQNTGPGGRTGQYGYSWWVRPFGAGEYDTYYAFGAWGQYIFVVPELNLVTVIASHYPENSYAPWPYFTDYILAACHA